MSAGCINFSASTSGISKPGGRNTAEFDRKAHAHVFHKVTLSASHVWRSCCHYSVPPLTWLDLAPGKWSCMKVDSFRLYFDIVWLGLCQAARAAVSSCGVGECLSQGSHNRGTTVLWNVLHTDQTHLPWPWWLQHGPSCPTPGHSWSASLLLAAMEYHTQGCGFVYSFLPLPSAHIT